MNRIIEFIKNKYHFFFIAAIVFFRGFYLLNGWGLGHMAADSGSYLYADLHISRLGRRVPLYPLFLKICRRMVHWDETAACAVAAALQCLLSLAVLYFLYQVLLAVTKNRLLSYITLLFYGSNVAILNWDSAIMTESLTLDMIILFLYVVIRYLEKKTVFLGSMAVLLSVAASMIKPTCAVLTGVCIAMVVLQFITMKDMRKKLIRIAAVIALAIVFYLAYCANTYKNYGTFNLTQLGPRHNLVTCLVTGTYKNYPDKDLVAQIDRILEEDRAAGKNIKRYPTTGRVMRLFSDDERERNILVAQFNRYCAKSDPMAHIMFKLDNIVKYWGVAYENRDWQLWDYAVEYNGFERLVYKIQKYVFSSVHIWFCFIMLAISIVMTAFLWVRRKAIPWHWLGMSGTILILLFAVYNNAYASFYRHTLFVLPCAYVSAAMFVSHILGLITGKKRAAAEAG